MNQAIDLSGQVVFITGGGRGIGREIAKRLSECGATIAVAARTASQLDETVAAITVGGGKAHAFRLDVTDRADVERVVSEISGHLGPIDLLINNAGVGGEGVEVWHQDPDAWWRALEVNLRGAFLCSHAVLQKMVKRNAGRIINVGSNSGIKSSPFSSAYGTSKAALLHFSTTLGEEQALANTEIRVFTISPGLVHTDMTKDVPGYQRLPDSAWTPIERAADLCAVLASGRADKLTGRFLHAGEDDIEALIRNADDVIARDAQVIHLRR